MPFNGSGTFTRLFNWNNDAINNLPISSTKFDGEDNDFALGLTNCLTRDGQGKPTSALSWTQPLSISVTGGSAPSLTLVAPANQPALQITSGSASTGVIINGAVGFSALQINAGGNGPNDDLFITGSNNAISAQLNNNQVSNATCNVSCGNDAGHFVVMEIASSGWTGSLITGAPPGQVALMGSTGNIPLLIMSNHVVAAMVSGGQNWTFPAPAGAGNTIQVSGPTGNLALFCIGSNATGQSFGIAVNGGTNLSDYALLCQNAGAVPMFKVRGDGIIMGAGPTAGLTDMTPDQGNLVMTMAGGTTAPTMSVAFYKIGKMVVIFVPGNSFASNATTFSIGGLPPELQPSSLAGQSSPMLQATNNGAQVFTANAIVNPGNANITFTLNGSSSGWTAAGTKAINAFCFAYLLN